MHFIFSGNRFKQGFPVWTPDTRVQTLDPILYSQRTWPTLDHQATPFKLPMEQQWPPVANGMILSTPVCSLELNNCYMNGIVSNQPKTRPLGKNK